ncbi:MAG: type II toxin-antitoxin system VapC family toxin [Acidobacteriaceae bacterium]
MIVLDTIVLSELMRPQPAPEVVNWLDLQPRPQLAVTAITEAEIFYGLEMLPAGKRRDHLIAAASAMFAEDFEGRSLAFDGGAALLYANIASSRRAKGRPISQADAQIAAIVRHNKAALATRNITDFEACGIQLVDPWGQKLSR